jgi:hypothetical protein
MRALPGLLLVLRLGLAVATHQVGQTYAQCPSEPCRRITTDSVPGLSLDDRDVATRNTWSRRLRQEPLLGQSTLLPKSTQAGAVNFDCIVAGTWSHERRLVTSSLLYRTVATLGSDESYRGNSGDGLLQ